MDKQRGNLIENLVHRRGRRRVARRAVALVSAFVLLMTTYTLKFNADALERVPDCGYEDHTHTGECYDETGALICDRHVHTDACFQTRPESEDLEALPDIAADECDTSVTEAEWVDLDDAPNGDADFIVDTVAADEWQETPAEDVRAFTFGARDAVRLDEILRAAGIEGDVVEAGQVVDERHAEGMIQIEQAEDGLVVRALGSFSEVELALVLSDDVRIVRLTDAVVADPTQSPEPTEVAESIEDNAESAEEPVEEPAEETTEEITEEPAEETAEEPAEESVEEVTEESTEDSVEEPTEEPAEETAEEPAEESVEEATEESTGEVDEEPAEEPIEDSVEEPVEEPAVLRHEATYDLNALEAPLNLLKMVSEAREAARQTSETAAEAIDEAVEAERDGAETAEGASSDDPETWSVEYDAALIQIDAAYDIIPTADFEATEITVQTEAEVFAFTLLNGGVEPVSDAAEPERAEGQSITLNVDFAEISAKGVDFDREAALDALDGGMALDILAAGNADADSALAVEVLSAEDESAADALGSLNMNAVEVVETEGGVDYVDGALVVTGDGSAVLSDGENTLTANVSNYAGLVDEVSDGSITVAPVSENAALPDGTAVFAPAEDAEDAVFNLIANINKTEAGEAGDGDAEARPRTLHVRLYDIGMRSGDEEIEPGIDVSVRAAFDAPIEGEDFALYHIVDGQPILMEDAVVAEDGAATGLDFVTDSFSPYAVAWYTVDFWHGEFEYHLTGGERLALSELFAALEIERDVADVASVVFSDPELLKVARTEDDWLLISLAPFDTEETLTVAFENGDDLVIRVTDALYDGDGGTGGVGYVKTFSLTSTVTGSGPFDSDDARGNDSSGDNHRIRSYDSIYYHVDVEAQSHSASEKIPGNLIYTFSVPDDDELQLDLSSMSWASLEFVNVENGQKTYTLKTNSMVNMPGHHFPQFVLKVGNKTEGYTVQPKIDVQVEDNSVKLSLDMLVTTVTSKPAYNVIGYALPSTGGVGTLPFIVGGLALILLSALLLVLRRREIR